MKILLLANVPKVGSKGEIKKVKDGFALNFLFPQKKAILATEEIVKDAEARRKISEGQMAEASKELAANLAKIDGKKIELKEKVNEKGHLFAQVHRDEIVNALEGQLKVVVGPEVIKLDDPIKEAGEHDIHCEAGDQKAVVKLTITAEK